MSISLGVGWCKRNKEASFSEAARVNIDSINFGYWNFFSDC
jgi:hypothetical protein